MQYSFSDLVEIPDIQQILVNFQSSSGISTEIMDMDGQIIVSSSSRKMWHELHPDAFRPRQSAGEISFQGNKKSSWHDEPIRGLFQYARAIHIEDREIGTVFL